MKGETETYFQFGRTGTDSFIMDFKYPLSPLQAFSIAVSALMK